RDLAPRLLPDLLARWLRDPEEPAARKGIYALLLGHSGRAEDARLLRSLLDDPPKNAGNNSLDNTLIGYTLLDWNEGWKYAHAILKDPSRDFTPRYAALRDARFFWEKRPGLIPRNELLEGVSLLLDQEDIADLAIEDLRKWGQWDCADSVLA